MTARSNRLAWARALRIGDSLDVLDTVQVWCEAVVIGLAPAQVFIHYRGWSAKYDEWITLRSSRLAPPYSHATNWRAALVVGKRVQITRPNDMPSGRTRVWRDGTVRETKWDETTLRVLVEVSGDPNLAWVDSKDDSLAAPGTHKTIGIGETSAENTPEPTAPISAANMIVSDASTDRDSDAGTTLPTDSVAIAAVPVALVRGETEADRTTDHLHELFAEWERDVGQMRTSGGEIGEYWAQRLETIRTDTMAAAIGNGTNHSSVSQDTMLRMAALEVAHIVDAIAQAQCNVLLSFRAKSIQVALEAIVAQAGLTTADVASGSGNPKRLRTN